MAWELPGHETCGGSPGARLHARPPPAALLPMPGVLNTETRSRTAQEAGLGVLVAAPSKSSRGDPSHLLPPVLPCPVAESLRLRLHTPHPLLHVFFLSDGGPAQAVWGHLIFRSLTTPVKTLFPYTVLGARPWTHLSGGTPLSLLPAQASVARTRSRSVTGIWNDVNDLRCLKTYSFGSSLVLLHLLLVDQCDL